jgi:predicted nuclease of predicted toxin-antitoxin system
MKVRFQADADLNAEIVAGVLRREPSIDFQTADEADLRRIPDPEVLALAAQENRILVTHDRRTMPRHFASFILHHSSPGVFIIAQTVSVLWQSRNWCWCGQPLRAKSGRISSLSFLCDSLPYRAAR